MAIDSRIKSAKNINKSDDLEVLLALKKNIFRDLKVASLGQVKEVNDSNISVSLFPTYSNESELYINCYKLNNLEINKNDVVLVLFLDKNFIQNLNQIKNNQTKSTLDSNNIELHSLKYGIIIGVI